MDEFAVSKKAIIVGLAVVTGLAVLSLWGAPQYNVYRLKMEGEALLAKSKTERQVLVSEAEAKKEAAKLLGEAELTKAEYQARASKAIAAGLSNEYLIYLWVMQQGDTNDKTIYVQSGPLGIPTAILEAGRGTLTAPAIPKPAQSKP